MENASSDEQSHSSMQAATGVMFSEVNRCPAGSLYILCI